MKIFSVVSTRKKAGKTFLSSLILSSLCYKKFRCAYYKPFQMNVEENHLPDIDYIKHSSPLISSDIYSSFGFIGDAAPMFLAPNRNMINLKEIRDTLLDNEQNYDAFVLEGIGIYEPVVENKIFLDIITNTYSIENNIIMVTTLDENVIDNTLSMIEAVYTRGHSVKMLIINESKGQSYSLEVLERVALYLKESVSPIPVFFMPYIEDKSSILYNKNAYIHSSIKNIANYIFNTL